MYYKLTSPRDRKTYRRLIWIKLKIWYKYAEKCSSLKYLKMCLVRSRNALLLTFIHHQIYFVLLRIKKNLKVTNQIEQLHLVCVPPREAIQWHCVFIILAKTIRKGETAKLPKTNRMFMLDSYYSWINAESLEHFGWSFKHINVSFLIRYFIPSPQGPISLSFQGKELLPGN